MSNPEIIIVGAGSAGCLLAHLLAKDGTPITLIEPQSTAAPRIDRQRPARWLHLLGSSEDWDFSTATVEGLAGRSLRWPRGRGLGGSNRINAMIWFPPTDEDLCGFAGVSRWSPQQLRDSLAEVESIVKPEPPRWLSESSQRFLAAAKSIPDSQPMIYQRVNRQGRRWNPAELLEGSDVNVVRAGVDRVVFDSQGARGVQLVSGESITCGGKVILCAGTIGTLTVLMRSGIGPRDVLDRCNIDVRHESPNVGANLQDHLIMPVIFGIQSHHRFPPQSSTAEIARWQSVGSGPLASNIAECGGLYENDRIQIHVTPTHYLTHPGPDAAAAMTIAVNATRPKSRGRLRISSADPNAHPIIEPDYLDNETDLQTTIDGIHLARKIAGHEPLSAWTTGELLPGSKRESDESIARAIMRYARTLYHPVGTCAIGDVVDEDLQVRGCSKLSIVDASVMNTITTGNPNSMLMTIAKLAATLRET